MAQICVKMFFDKFTDVGCPVNGSCCMGKPRKPRTLGEAGLDVGLYEEPKYLGDVGCSSRRRNTFLTLWCDLCSSSIWRQPNHGHRRGSGGPCFHRSNQLDRENLLQEAHSACAIHVKCYHLVKTDEQIPRIGKIFKGNWYVQFPLSLKFPLLLRPSQSKVFDKAYIKKIFTYLLFKTAHDTNLTQMSTYIDGDARPHHRKN